MNPLTALWRRSEPVVTEAPRPLPRSAFASNNLYDGLSDEAKALADGWTPKRP